MLAVSHDAVSVELDLRVGQVACPGCGGRLRPWGWARAHVIREGLGTDWVSRRLRPRRARCVACVVSTIPSSPRRHSSSES